MFKQTQKFLSSAKDTLNNFLAYIPTRVLFSACRSGNIKLAKMALDKGADINATRKFVVSSIYGSSNDFMVDTVYETPLLCAARSSRYAKDETIAQRMVNFLMSQPTLNLYAAAKLQTTRFIQANPYEKQKSFQYKPENISFIDMVNMQDDFKNYCLSDNMRVFLKNKIPAHSDLSNHKEIIEFVKQQASRQRSE